MMWISAAQADYKIDPIFVANANVGDAIDSAIRERFNFPRINAGHFQFDEVGSCYIVSFVHENFVANRKSFADPLE